MKYSVKLTRENGKTVTLAANEYIDIDVNAGNRQIAALTLRKGILQGTCSTKGCANSDQPDDPKCPGCAHVANEIE